MYTYSASLGAVKIIDDKLIMVPSQFMKFARSVGLAEGPSLDLAEEYFHQVSARAQAARVGVQACASLAVRRCVCALLVRRMRAFASAGPRLGGAPQVSERVTTYLGEFSDSPDWPRGGEFVTFPEFPELVCRLAAARCGGP